MWQNRIPQGHRCSVCISQPAGRQAWLQTDASNDDISIRNWTAMSTDVHECLSKSGLKLATADRWDQCHQCSWVDTTCHTKKKNFRKMLHPKCTRPSSSKSSCNDSTTAFRMTTFLQRNCNTTIAEVTGWKQTMTFPMRLSYAPFSIQPGWRKDSWSSIQTGTWRSLRFSSSQVVNYSLAEHNKTGQRQRPTRKASREYRYPIISPQHFHSSTINVTK